jgi:hypothetical protein
LSYNYTDSDSAKGSDAGVSLTRYGVIGTQQTVSFANGALLFPRVQQLQETSNRRTEHKTFPGAPADYGYDEGDSGRQAQIPGIFEATTQMAVLQWLEHVRHFIGQGPFHTDLQDGSEIFYAYLTGFDFTITAGVDWYTGRYRVVFTATFQESA